ncbi:class II fructose-bisphosphate aldolase [Propionibacteriaceae bacterium Y2011]|uniref:class II fructose-bisphosphate aldolase n=1 Tax=Microlunatus sp. Y2014 TaxID=3418488 RepID=UPI003B4E817F
MTTARLTDLLSDAREGSVAVGAFNVISIEHAEALVAGAEQAQAPVVLQLSENAIRYHGRLEPIALATLSIARSASVPTVVHLDHITDTALVDEGIELGVGSVMFDGSVLPYEENVAATAAVVRQCHEHGIDVEAELGEVGGKDGVHAPGARTEPAEAVSFVSATGVDALAVAVGSSHAMTERTSKLDLDLIGALAAAVPVPLVLHGSSGVPDDEILRGVRAGMTKINIATHLNKVFTDRVRAALTDERLVDTRKYLGPARDAVAAEVARLLGLLRTSPIN